MIPYRKAPLSTYKALSTCFPYIADYGLKYINNKKGRTISNPAFMRISSLSVLLSEK
jgi:hypothetical protein